MNKKLAKKTAPPESLLTFLEDFCPEPFFSKIKLQLFYKLLAQTEIVGDLEIATAIRYRFRPLLLALLEKYPLEQISEAAKISFWEIAIARGDIHYLNFLKNRCHLPLPDNFNSRAQLGLTALLYGSPKVLHWLIKQIKLTEVITAETLADTALEFGNIAVAQKALASLGLSSSAVREKIASWMEESAERNKRSLEEELDLLFLSSEEKEVKKISSFLASKHPDQAKKLQKAHKERRLWGAFISRYNSIALRSHQLHLYHIPYNNFLSSQKSLGENGFALVSRQLQKIKNEPALSLKDIFKEFALWYSEKRREGKDKMMGKECFLFRDEQSAVGRQTVIGNAAGDSSYAAAISIVEKVYLTFSEKKDLLQTDSFSEDPISYVINYFETANSKAIPLTKIFIHDENKEWTWLHEAEPKKLWPKMEKLHKKILSYTLIKTDKENVEGLHRLIAKAYWLGVHTMITWRGNSFYMRLTMALWYLHHNMSPPLPCLSQSNLDLPALSMPEEKFTDLEFYLSCFSLPPK